MKAEELYKELNSINNSGADPSGKLADMQKMEGKIVSFLGTNGFADLMKELQDLKDKKKKEQEAYKAANEKKVCPNCGKENGASFNFCVFCMAKLNGEEQNGNGKTDEDIEKERQKAYAEAQKKAEEEEKRKTEDETKKKAEDDVNATTGVEEEFEKNKERTSNESVEKEEVKNAEQKANGEFGREKIEQLKKELEEARKKYAGGDYKINTTFNRLKEAFGLHIKTKPEDISELNEASNAYKSKASELMRELIDEIKNKNLDPETMKKELGNLVKYFNYDEKMNLYAARTSARSEANKDNKAFEILKKGEQFINWYRKVDWKKKMAFSFGLGIITGGSLLLGQRALGSVAAGVGAVAGMEAYQRRKEQKKSEAQKEELLKNFENSQEKMDEIMQKLQAEIDDYEKSLDNEQRKALGRKFIGLGAALGTFAVGTLASGAIKDLGGQAFENIKNFFGIGETISNVDQPDLPQKGSIDSENYLTSNDAPTGPKNIPNAESLSDSGNVIENDVKSGVFAEKVLEVKKGSSLEGTLIKHLEGTGLNHEEAGKMAHKMAIEYADNNNLKDGPYSVIHEGAKLKISPEGKLVEISGDDHLGYLSKNEIPTSGGDKGQIFENARPKGSVEPLTVDKVNEVPMEKFDLGINQQHDIADLNHKISEMRAEVDEIRSKGFGFSTELDQARGSMTNGGWANIQEANIRDLQIEAAKKYGSMFNQFLGNGNLENLKGISGLRAADVFENRSSGVRKIYEYLMNRSDIPAGDKSWLKPSTNEKVSNWVTRISAGLAKRAI